MHLPWRLGREGHTPCRRPRPEKPAVLGPQATHPSRSELPRGRWPGLGPERAPSPKTRQDLAQGRPLKTPLRLLQMAVRYTYLTEPPTPLPSGQAALLELYNLQ